LNWFECNELRLILNPKDLYGPDFRGETFRVLKEKEEKQYGDSAEQLYKRKSNRMILGAF